MSKSKQPTIKHVAMRTCIATGEKKPKKDMLRIVKTADNKIVIDIYGKVRGRGANISRSLEAFDLAVKKNSIVRALKLGRPLAKPELAELKQEFSKALEEKAFRPYNRPVTIKVSKEQLQK